MFKARSYINIVIILKHAQNVDKVRQIIGFILFIL